MGKPGNTLRSRDEIVSRFHRKERRRSAKSYKRFLKRECGNDGVLRGMLPKLRDYLDSLEDEVFARAAPLLEQRGSLARRDLRAIVRAADRALRQELSRRIEKARL